MHCPILQLPHLDEHPGSLCPLLHRSSPIPRRRHHRIVITREEFFWAESRNLGETITNVAGATMERILHCPSFSIFGDSFHLPLVSMCFWFPCGSPTFLLWRSAIQAFTRDQAVLTHSSQYLSTPQTWDPIYKGSIKCPWPWSSDLGSFPRPISCICWFSRLYVFDRSNLKVLQI